MCYMDGEAFKRRLVHSVALVISYDLKYLRTTVKKFYCQCAEVFSPFKSSMCITMYLSLSDESLLTSLY